jgi:hypothetical protein
VLGTDHVRLGDLNSPCHNTAVPPPPLYTFVRLHPQFPGYKKKKSIQTFGWWLVVLGTDHVCLGDLNGPRRHTTVASMVGRRAAHTFDQLLVVFHDRIPCILNNKQNICTQLFPKRFYEK